MSKIINDGLAWSDTGWLYPCGNSGRQEVNLTGGTSYHSQTETVG